MAKRTAVLSRAARSAPSDQSDHDLLNRFAADGDQAAFAAVVRRHTAMVHGVCQRVLHSPADAEDATQAVFVVLANKAGSTRWRASAANWLYTTARKVAANARLAAERRTRRERGAAVPEAVHPADAMSGREMIAALDDELDKLAPRYREPLVLCYLEGLTRDEAAARLNQTVPALNKQLERGRHKLADALAARGCALSVLLLAAAATSPAGASPPRIVESVLAAAGGNPSASVAALAQGVAMNGVFARTRLAVLAVAGLTVLGFGVAALPSPADPPKPTEKADVKPAEVKELTLRGTVVGPDGTPVAGAAITTLKPGKGNDEVLEELAKTDAAGGFTVKLPPVPASRFDYRMLGATKTGFGADWVHVREVGDGPVSLKLTADDVTVTGRVTDLEGMAVPRATVRLKGVSGGDFGKVWAGWANSPYLALREAEKQLDRIALVGLPASVTADADGKFEIKGVGRGRMLAVVFEGAGIESAGCRVVLDPKFDPKVVQRPTTATMPGGVFQPGPDLYPPAFTHAARPDQPVRGTVTDAATGQPVAGVMVSAASDDPHWGEGNTTATTDKDGRFVIRGVAKSKRVQVAVYPSDGQPYFHYHTVLAGQPGLTEIAADLQLTRGVLLKVKVVEKGSGEPVSGAGIQYTALADNKHYAEVMAGRGGESGKITGTDRDGRVEMVVLPGAGVVLAQGECQFGVSGSRFTQVRIAAADRSRGSTQYGVGECFTAADNHVIPLWNQSGYAIIDPKPTDRTAEVTIEFDRGATAGGTVLAPDSRPATGVTAHGLTACYDFPQRLKDGTFTALALDPAHPRWVVFADPAKKLAAAVELKGEEKDLTVKLQPWGQLTGRLLDADGKPTAGADVAVHVKRPTKYEGFMEAVRGLRTTTDADGRFTLDVPGGPAEYAVRFSKKNKSIDTGYSPQTPGHAVKPGETTDVGDVQAKE